MVLPSRCCQQELKTAEVVEIPDAQSAKLRVQEADAPTLKGSVLASFEIKFILFFGFNFQCCHTAVARPLVRLRQQFLPEGFAAKPPATTDVLQFPAIHHRINRSSLFNPQLPGHGSGLLP
jgi:hypothetical protein